MITPERKAEVLAYIKHRIAVVMEWYTGPGSEAVDCKETRANINKDLDCILPETVKKFKLKKIPRVLRVRTTPGQPGIFTVRTEKPDLC